MIDIEVIPMARPVKRRRVCRMPGVRDFAPCGKAECETVTLTVDEYEALRLADLEGLTQEECAVQMDVSRASVCATLDSARHKLADMVVNGKGLRIEGGSVVLCEHQEHCHGHQGACSHRKSCPRGRRDWDEP